MIPQKPCSTYRAGVAESVHIVEFGVKRRSVFDAILGLHRAAWFSQESLTKSKK